MASSSIRSGAGKKDFDLGWERLYEERWPEAEQLFRRSAREQEKILGKEHVDTLESKHGLAFALHEQQKYSEAEQLFRQSLQGRERVLGKTHVDTLWGEYRLAVTLHAQQNYLEAGQLLRLLIQEGEETQGKEHILTLSCKYRLALTLHAQHKYFEAEQLLRLTILVQEKVLGAEDEDTLYYKYRLTLTLYAQQKYVEAEQLLRQTISVQEKVLGAEDEDTIKSKRLLQELLLAITPPSSVSSATENTVLSRLSDFFLEGKKGEVQYADVEIGQISLLLNHLSPQWSKVPRTYIILRTISCLNLLDNLIDLGFSDHWLPVTERSLPHCLRPSQRSEFVIAQDLVITKSIGLEKSEGGQHCYFRRDEPLPFEVKGILGSVGRLTRFLA